MRIDGRPHGRRQVRALRIVASVTFFGLVAVAIFIASAFAVATRLSAYDEMDSATLFRAVKAVTLAEIGENPHFQTETITGPIPLCVDVPKPSIKPLKRALALMRGTAEGRRLFEMLVDNDVCVTIDDLPYNAAYAESRRVVPGDWSTSRIVVDRDLVRSTATDLLAAILVHEATHIDRAVSGEACFITDRCERLANGVEIGEEIAAHAAEAEFWIEAFGSDGKRFAFGGDHSENRLARAYMRGQDAFRSFVIEFRSDPREGQGF